MANYVVKNGKVVEKDNDSKIYSNVNNYVVKDGKIVKDSNNVGTNLISNSNNYVVSNGKIIDDPNNVKKKNTTDYIKDTFKNLKSESDNKEYGYSKGKTNFLTVMDTLADLAGDFSKGVFTPVEQIGDIATNLVASGADLLGYDKSANKMRKFANRDLLDELLTNDKTEAGSVAGNTADQIANTIGYVSSVAAGSNLLGKVNIPHVSSSGNIALNLGKHTLNLPVLSLIGGGSEGLNEANNKKNINELERWSKAFSSASIEGITEGLFGFLGVGGNDITDKLKINLLKKAKTSAGKMLTQLGIESTSEVAEEVISYFSNYIIDNNIIDKLGNADFRKEISEEELVNTIITTAISTTLSGGANIKVGQNQAIKQAEQEMGHKLSNDEKKQITSKWLSGSLKNYVDTKITEVEQNTNIGDNVDEKKIASIPGLQLSNNRSTLNTDIQGQQLSNDVSLRNGSQSLEKTITNISINDNNIINEQNNQVLKTMNSDIIPYTSKEKNNFMLSTKIKIADTANDIKKFVAESKKVKSSNTKLYLGKISNNIANKIKQKTGIDIENFNISLKMDAIKHILSNHSNSKEILRGQIPIVENDFNLIPEIISSYDDVKLDKTSKNGNPILVFKKEIDGIYYLVSYASNRQHNLEIKTMYKHKKKNSATADNIQKDLFQTPETDNGTSSHMDNDTIKTQNSQIAPLSNNSNMQNNQNNDLKGNKILNPVEISNLQPKDASTTPLLPKKKYNKKSDGDSKFFDNIKDKTNMLTEQQKEFILSEDDVKYYDTITNRKSLDAAFERLNKNGTEETENWFSKDSEKATAVDVAEGWILLKQYADKNNPDGMVAVAKKLRDMGTKAGQTVQAFNIMERMSPEGMVKYAQSELSEAYEQMVKNKTKEWIDEYREDFDLKPEEVAFIMQTMEEVSKMEDGYEKRVKLAEIQKVMTDKLPPERGAGIKAWMRISMLFNPKTQVRNIGGNAVIMPINYFSDLFASMVDKAISKKTGVRTIGKTNLKSYLKGFKSGLYQSYNDYKKGINTRNIEGNRFEITQGKSFNDNTKIGKLLNRVDSLLSFMLDAGDRGFYEASFTNSINNQLVLNNTTEVTQTMNDIAIQEGLSRTWQDNNGYTKFVLQTRDALNKINVKGYGLGDVLIPFAKTPANLTKAIVDYSPAGLVNALVSGRNLKNSLSNGQYNAQLQHKFVQDLGKATAGTMLYVLGYALAQVGIVSGESDDDKDTRNFMKNTLGINSYSIKIGDKSFTYDWAQPIAAPLSIMANYVNKSEKNKDASKLENLISSLDVAGNILLQQSFMESINTVLSNNDGIATGIQEAIMELPSRAIPTLMKQIVDLTDSTQRQTFEYDQPLKTALNKVKAKIPGLSKTLTPSIDTMGREIKKYGGKNNIFNIFLNPANVNTENISESASEIYKIYKATGDKTIMPRAVAYYINQDGKKIILTTEQRKDYQKISGQIIEDNVKLLKNNSNYKKMSDTEKAAVINNIVNYSYNKARLDVLDIEMSNQYNKVNEWVNNGGKIYEYYANKEENDFSLENPSKYSTMTHSSIDYYDFLEYQKKVNNIKDQYSGSGNSNVRKQKVFQYINGLSYNKNQKIILFNMLGGYSIKDYQSSIFNYINNLDISKKEKEEMWKYLYGN